MFSLYHIIFLWKYFCAEFVLLKIEDNKKNGRIVRTTFGRKTKNFKRRQKKYWKCFMRTKRWNGVDNIRQDNSFAKVSSNEKRKFFFVHSSAFRRHIGSFFHRNRLNVVFCFIQFSHCSSNGSEMLFAFSLCLLFFFCFVFFYLFRIIIYGIMVLFIRRRIVLIFPSLFLLFFTLVQRL